MIYLISWFVPVQRHTWRSQWFVSLWLFPPSLSLSHRSNSRVYDYWVLWPYKTPLAHPLTHAHTLARTFSTSASPSLSLDTHSNQRGAILVHTRVTATLFLPERWSSRERERERRGEGELTESGREGERERETPLCPPFNLCLGLHFIPWFVSLSTIFKIRPS